MAKDLMAQGSGEFPEVSLHLEYPITGTEEVSHKEMQPDVDKKKKKKAPIKARSLKPRARKEGV